MKKLLTALVTLSLLLSFGTSTLSASSTKKIQGKPFLIQGKLPHLTMMIKVLWNDSDLALSADQKAILLQVRKETIGGAKALAKQIFPLENKIVKASFAGATPESQKADVEKLANLRAKATMLHLKCIYNTRQILNKEQLDILE
jgi:hypothetical protein